MRRIVLCTLVLALSSVAVAGPADDFEALLDEAWEWQLRENPMFASSLGDRRYNDRWQDESLAAIARRQEQTRSTKRTSSITSCSGARCRMRSTSSGSMAT